MSLKYLFYNVFSNDLPGFVTMYTDCIVLRLIKDHDKVRDNVLKLSHFHANPMESNDYVVTGNLTTKKLNS